MTTTDDTGARPIEELAWQEVTAGTERLRVSGGWVYKSSNMSGLAMVFVPDPPARPE